MRAISTRFSPFLKLMVRFSLPEFTFWSVELNRMGQYWWCRFLGRFYYVINSNLISKDCGFDLRFIELLLLWVISDFLLISMLLWLILDEEKEKRMRKGKEHVSWGFKLFSGGCYDLYGACMFLVNYDTFMYMNVAILITHCNEDRWII